MSEPKTGVETKTGQSKNRMLLLLAFCISGGLVAALISSGNRMRRAKNVVEHSRQRLAKISKELDAFTDLEKEEKQLSNQLLQKNRQIEMALRSFEQRKEFEPELKRILEATNLDAAIIVKKHDSNAGLAYWIWIPEEGHRLLVELEPNFAKDAQLSKSIRFIDQQLSLEVEPRKVHTLEFSVKPRFEEKDHVLSLILDGKRHASQELEIAEMIGEKSNGTMLGQVGYALLPGYLPNAGLAFPRQQEFEWSKGIWLTMDATEFVFKLNEDTNVGQKIRIAIASESDVCVSDLEALQLKNFGFELGEPIQDDSSPYFQMLPIIRWPENNTSHTEKDAVTSAQQLTL